MPRRASVEVITASTAAVSTSSPMNTRSARRASRISAGRHGVAAGTAMAMLALIAIGLNVVVGQTGLLDLGYVGFYAVGAYTYALLASPKFGLHLPFLVILPILGVIEKPEPMPSTIEEDFNAHYGANTHPAE